VIFRLVARADRSVPLPGCCGSLKFYLPNAANREGPLRVRSRPALYTRWTSQNHWTRDSNGTTDTERSRCQPRTGKVRRAYQFIKANAPKHDVRTLCRLLQVAPSGYYAGLQAPISNRGLEDARPLRLIRASFVASQGIYGAPRVFLYLRELGRHAASIA
jgi:hypothetical protein